MRHGISRPPARAKPWHARTEARLGVAVLAMLLLAGGAAAARSNDGEPPPPAVALAPQQTAVAPNAVEAPAAPATANLTPQLTPQLTPPLTPQPTPQPTPAPMLIDLRPALVGQGETMLVWVHAPGAASVTLEFRGGVYRLLAEAEVFWGVVALPLDAPLGTGELTLTARSNAGEVLDSAVSAYEVEAVDRPVDYLVLTAEQASVLTPEAAIRERELRAQIFAEFDRGRRWTTYFRRPAAGPVTTAFGQGRSYNGGPVGSFHTGTDFATPEGAPVVATAPARVAWVGEMPIRGLSVILDHGAGVKSGYHHLQSATVTADERVQAGQPLGAAGQSGLATGPHLHWELTVWGVNVNPLSWTLKDFTP